MAGSGKFTIYLAGPISGCNDDQKHRWRNDVKKKYAKDFDFIDPCEGDPAGPGGDAGLRRTSQLHVVEADLEAIKRSDGFLANMWRESIGTTLGIVHANETGRPVVVADPNGLRHHMLEFYADAVEDSVLKAAKALRDILRAEAWQVLKSGGRLEEFKRRKIRWSVQQVCRQANTDDIGVPSVVLPKVIEILAKGGRRIDNAVASKDIGDAVLRVFKRMERKKERAFKGMGLSSLWAYGLARPQGLAGSVAEPSPGSRIRVQVYSPKAHSTIWGRRVGDVEDIPSRLAREAVRTIASVPGVTRVVLGQFSGKESRVACSADVLASDMQNVIEGRLFDRGERGTMQTFKAYVQDDDMKPQVMTTITKALEQKKLWAGTRDAPTKTYVPLPSEARTKTCMPSSLDAPTETSPPDWTH